jgi:hypothetical protein
MKLTTIHRNGDGFSFTFFDNPPRKGSTYYFFEDFHYYDYHQLDPKDDTELYESVIKNLSGLLQFYRQKIADAPSGTTLYCPFLFDDQYSAGLLVNVISGEIEVCITTSTYYGGFYSSLIHLQQTIIPDPSVATKKSSPHHFSLEAFLEHFDQLIEDVLRNLDNPPLPAWYGALPPSASELQIEFYKDRDFGFVLSDVLTIYFSSVWLFRRDGLQHYRLMADNEGLSLVAFFNQWLSRWRKRVQALRVGQGLFIPIELADTYIGGIQLQAAEGDALQLSYGFWHNPDQQPYTALEGRPFDEVMKTFSTTKERILQSLVLEVQ